MASIRKRGRSWEVRIYRGRGPNGRPLQDVYTTYTREEARAIAHEKELDLHHGRYRVPIRQSLTEYLVGWLATHPMRATTRRGYQERIHRYVAPTIGHFTLNQIRDETLESLYRAMLTDGLSPGTVRGVNRVLSSALKDAKIYLRPSLPPDTAQEAPSLTIEQVRTLLTSYRGYPLGALAVFALLTGLRRSELCGLQWEDIDVNQRVVTVRRGRHVLEAIEQLTPPKSQRGLRRIALPAVAVNVLAGLNRVGPWVFCRADGKPWHPSTVSHCVTAFLKDCGIAASLHPLRHSQATMLMQAGVHPRVVSGRLGHASVLTTLDRYSHVQPVQDREAADAVDRLVAIMGSEVPHASIVGSI